MAGTAKTDAFMLGTATVMVGPQNDLFNLNPDQHSVGLVKNFSISSDPQYTDLTQGVKNTNVMSVMTQNQVSASMEVYEYTARNVTYALGLDGSTNTRITDETTTSTAQDGTSTPITDLQVTNGSLFTAGDFLMLSINDDDHAYIRQVSSISTNTLTLHTGIAASIPSGAKVFRLNKVSIGSKTDQPFFSSKVVGKLANGDPVTILIPKIRVVNGFNLNFSSEDFANLPMEFTIFDLTTTDPNFSFFGGDSAQMFGR